MAPFFLVMATIEAGRHCFQQIQAVMFDKDGTLAAVEPYLYQLGQRRAEILNTYQPGVKDDLLQAFGITAQGMNPAGSLAVASRYENIVSAATYLAASGLDWMHALDLATAAFREADQAFLPNKAEYTPMIKGVRSLLDTLNQAQVKLGLLSADVQYQVESFARTYGLADTFDYLQGTTQNQPTKTHSQFLSTACQSLQVDAARVLVIGDSSADLKMAEIGGAAGFIGFSGGWRCPRPITGALVTINCYSQLQVRV
jgi:phosphoglycolate phosphatase